jgi:diguanylate cyclase (GGDEF)-like protein
LAVEALLADGKPVMENGVAVVPAGTHGLEVRYAAMSLRAPERVRFKYRLVGFDAGWVEAGTRRTAYYTNVPPGRYRFEMTACNEDGVWNEAGTSIPVRVLPRFYQTAPFLVACIVLVALAAWGGYRLRVRQLRVRERKLVALVDEQTARLRDTNTALEERTRQVSEANRALEERGQELEAANRLLTELSYRDALTGIANRRHFETVLGSEWRRAARTGSPLSLLMADVDSFKAYNDTYGHPAGDACLQRVAFALQSGLRRAGDLLARYGGEEFVVVLPDMPLEPAAALAEELRLRLRSLQVPHSAGVAAPVVTVSVGVACCHPQAGGSPGDLVDASDRALYKAKKAGRNRVYAD